MAFVDQEAIFLHECDIVGLRSKDNSVLLHFQVQLGSALEAELSPDPLRDHDPSGCIDGERCIHTRNYTICH